MGTAYDLRHRGIKEDFQNLLYAKFLSAQTLCCQNFCATCDDPRKPDEVVAAIRKHPYLELLYEPGADEHK